MNYVKLGAVLGGVCLLSQAQVEGIVIRDDVSVSEYDALADNPAFAAAGWIGTASEGRHFCSGTLIAPNLFLTAAHCVDNNADGILDFAANDFAVGFEQNVPEEVRANVREIHVHSSWANAGDYPDGAPVDLALVYLTEAVEGITPMVISDANPDGAVGTSVGYGRQGLGSTGAISDDNIEGADDRLAGQNIMHTFVTDADGEEFGLRGGLLFADFDDPNDLSASEIGDRVPLALEASGAPGDSGSGLYTDLNNDGVYEISGVLSGGQGAAYGGYIFWSWLGNPDVRDFLLEHLLPLIEVPDFVVPVSTIDWGVYHLQRAGTNASFQDVNSRILRQRSAARRRVGKDLKYSNTTEYVRADDGTLVERKQRGLGSYLHVFGSLYGHKEKIDGVSNSFVNIGETDARLFGGSVGIEYDSERYFTGGLAFSASKGTADLTSVDSVDVDYKGFAGYLTMQYPLMNRVELVGDVMVGYLEGDYSTSRDFGTDHFGAGIAVISRDNGSARGTTESEATVFQGSLGLNFDTRGYIHGPIVEYRKTEETIDAYTETGNHASSYQEIDYDSDYVRVGYQATANVSNTLGTMYLNVRAMQQFGDSGEDLVVLGQSLENEYDATVLGASLSVHWDGGMYSSFNYEGQFADRRDSHHMSLHFGFGF